MIAYITATELRSGAAPDWVRLIPAGAFNAGAGETSYRLENAIAIIGASIRPGDKLPVDENHATGRGAGHPHPACGWIDGMEARKDGIWGHIQWNSKGRSLIADRAYRWLFPVVEHTQKGAITRVLRLSFSNSNDGMSAMPTSAHISNGAGGVIVLTPEDFDVCRKMGIDPDALATYKKLGRDHCRIDGEDHATLTAMGLNEDDRAVCRKMNLSTAKYAEHKKKVEAELAAPGNPKTRAF
jgi:phage I-like protein